MSIRMLVVPSLVCVLGYAAPIDAAPPLVKVIPVAKAVAGNPVAQLVFGYVIGKIADCAFSSGSSSQGSLAEIENNAALKSELREEIRKVRIILDKKLSKEDLEKELSKLSDSLSRINNHLFEIDERFEEVEATVVDLRADVQDLVRIGKDSDDAKKEFAQFKEHKNSLDPKYYIGRGKDFARNDNHKRAIANFSIAVRLSEGAIRAEAYCELGKLFASMGSHDLYKRTCDKAIEADPKFADAYVHRATAYTSLEQYDKVIRDCGMALAINIDLQKAFALRCQAYLVSKSDEEYMKAALYDADHAVRLRPSACNYYLRGIAHSKTKNYNNAIRDLSEAIRLDPEWPTSYLHRSEAYSANGDAGNAETDRKKYEELKNRK